MKISEKKALEAYPICNCYNEQCMMKEDVNFESRIAYEEGYDKAMQDMVKDSEHLKYLSDEMGYAYACGCRKTMQDFMEKACTFLKNRTMAELCLDSESTELVDDFIEDFKNYMEEEL